MRDITADSWHSVPLEEVCSIEKTKHSGNPATYVGLEDVSNNTGEFLGSDEPTSVKSATFQFDERHLLYGRLRPYLNKVLTPDFNGHCSSEIFPLLPSDQLDRRYLFYWLTSDPVRQRINATSTGARMPRANMNEVMRFDFPLPPLEEQQRIVAVLDEVFEGLARARAHAEANLQNARELFESMLSTQLTSSSGGWETHRLADCFRLRSGDNLTSKKMVPGEYPVYGGNGIAGTHNNSNLSGNHVIVGRVGALCGNARYIDHDIWLTDNAFKVVDFRFPFDHQFLTYLLNFKKLRNLARQAAQPVISNSSLAELELSFPASVAVQESIAARLANAEGELGGLQSKYERKIEDLEDLRQSLLKKAFAGELS